MYFKVLKTIMKNDNKKIGEKLTKNSMLELINRQRLKSLSSKPTSDVKSFFRVAIHGAGRVGKSCIIQRLINNEFTNGHTPTVSEVYEKELKTDERVLGTFWLYDTAGSIDFPVMNRLTITKSDACVVVYSIDDKHSLEVAEQRLEEIKQMKGQNFPCILVGNKNDCKGRIISFETGLKCAVKYNASYVESSARDNKNIRDIFECIATKIHRFEQYQQQERRGIAKSFSSKR